MDYGKIKGNNYVVVLFEYYMVCNGKKSNSNEIFVKSADLREIIDDLKKIEDMYIFFDMKHVKKAASRAFAFLKEEKVLNKIVFFHVQKGSEVFDCLSADLPVTVEEEKGFCFICFADEAKEQFCRINIEKVYQRKRIEILKKYVNNEITFLPSSGVYSNMSLDYKEMFEHSEDFGFIICDLYYEIRYMEEKQKFNFLVAASKNAIALTAILGNQLGKPVIYHTNIGQKYVKQKFSDKVENQTDAVQKTKKYLMIFDVICLGTEARILNGIINVLGGHLIGALGMVCVQQPEVIRLLDEDSILAKARCLATAREMGLGYRIALTKEELEENSNGG